MRATLQTGPILCFIRHFSILTRDHDASDETFLQPNANLRFVRPDIADLPFVCNLTSSSRASRRQANTLTFRVLGFGNSQDYLWSTWTIAEYSEENILAVWPPLLQYDLSGQLSISNNPVGRSTIYRFSIDECSMGLANFRKLLWVDPAYKDPRLPSICHLSSEFIREI